MGSEMCIRDRYIALDVDSKATKAELLEVAEKHSVDVSKDDTKAIIIKALEG